jgi:hypothetical protein
MTPDSAPDRLIARLRERVAELRRLERGGASRRELDKQRRAIAELQRRLAYAVRDLLQTQGMSPA